ncbi:MAG: hypothetical protein HN975_04240, partial [Anaerolineae bacterium]|nr:hypothetical protein [Anaerolineae bacterium]
MERTPQKIRFSQPIQLPKRMVVDGDRLYVTLGWNAPISVINAGTGELIEVLSETNCADEILLSDGKLILSTYEDAVRPLDFVGIENSSRVKKKIQVIDLSSSRMLWESNWLDGLNARLDAVAPQTHLELTVRSGKVFAITKDSIVCFSLQNGERLWAIPRPEHPIHRMNLGVNMGDN